MRRNPHRAEILNLHDRGLTVRAIRRRVGQSYAAVQSVIYRADMKPNVALLLDPGKVGPWDADDLADALMEPAPVNPWVQLAQRLAWSYGEAEALRRINTKGGT